MQKYSFVCLVIFICCIIGSCRLKEKNENDILISLKDTSSKLIDVSSIFKNMDAIELNLPDNKPIGEILKIKVLVEKLIVLYRFQDYHQNYIAVFQSNGDFQYQLAPDKSNHFEYNPLDISIIDQETFAVLEEYSNAIIFHSPQGDPLKRQQLPFSAKEFAYLSEREEFIFHKKKKAHDLESEEYFYNLIFTDQKFSIKNKFFPFSISEGERELVNLPFSLYQQNDDHIFFQKVLSDTVFSVSAYGVDTSNSIIFDTGNKSLASQNGQVGISNYIQEILNKDGIVVGGHLFYSDKFLFFQYATLTHPGIGLYNLTTGKLQSGLGMVSRDKTWINIPLGSSSHDGLFYSYLNEYSLQYAPPEVLENNLAQLALDSGKHFYWF